MRKSTLLALFTIPSLIASAGYSVHAQSAAGPPAFLEARSPYDTNPQKVAQLPQRVVRRNAANALPAADVIAIHELISRVYLAEDSLDREALRQSVTADFILEDSVTGRSTGRDAFADLVIKGAAFRAGNRHMALNLAVSADGENKAAAVHYLFAIRVFSSDAKTAELPQPLAHGIVRDQLVKEKGTWRLAHRISDQVSILPSILPDDQLRTQAARVIAPSQNP